MKTVVTLLVVLTSLGASASGGGSSKEDILFSLSIIGVLVIALGLVYLSDFIGKIRKDKDYREHLRTRVLHLISTVRPIFQKKSDSENEKRIDFSVSLAH